MKVFDKAMWHVDGKEPKKEVITRFQVIFEFLNKKNMLSEEGIEILEFGIDDSISLHEFMINKNGRDFLSKYYDEILHYDPNIIKKNLTTYYIKWHQSNKELTKLLEGEIKKIVQEG